MNFMLLKKIENEIEILEKNNNLRTLKTYSEKLLNLSSNDYLGLAQDLDLRTAFYNRYPNLLLSSSSSRLITGTSSLVESLESKLEDIYQNSGILFNSGFDANSCIIETFCDKNTLIISDKLNHASIYDGIVHSGAQLLRYRHLDLDHLESILKKYRDKFENIFVISETIYSMDGDCVDLEKLISLKRDYSFLLILDEAHSFGVYGYGMAYEMDIIQNVDFLIIPLGKGGASIGSYVICNSIYKQYIVNRGRKFIYTTALPPVNIAWNLFILENMPKFKEKRDALNRLINFTLEKIKEYNLETISSTQIISIIIGDNKKADTICRNLIEKGFLVYAVKEPTVPKGTARIRLGLNPTFTEEEIQLFLKELKYELDTIF